MNKNSLMALVPSANVFELFTTVINYWPEPAQVKHLSVVSL
jgi:hypothetical protein